MPWPHCAGPTGLQGMAPAACPALLLEHTGTLTFRFQSSLLSLLVPSLLPHHVHRHTAGNGATGRDTSLIPPAGDNPCLLFCPTDCPSWRSLFQVDGPSCFNRHLPT